LFLSFDNTIQSKDNPNSVLAQVPQQEFTSRYADPKNHAASGSLIAFVSGGHLVPEPHSRGLIGGVASVVGQAVRGEQQGQAWENLPANTLQNWNQYSRGYRGRRQRSSEGRVGIVSTPVGLVKKVLKQVCLSSFPRFCVQRSEEKGIINVVLRMCFT
jgi:hypothetical protein